MRLWTIHPVYLDRVGLLACWRESLLAQKVLYDETRGYRNHPQLQRFRATGAAQNYIAAYLRELLDHAAERNYSFSAKKIRRDVLVSQLPPIDVTRGQVEYEFQHLQRKLVRRDMTKHSRNVSMRLCASGRRLRPVKLHPLFRRVAGMHLESWEAAK